MLTLEKHQSQKILGFKNAKTEKGEKKDVRTGIVYLAPHKVSGKNLCAFATEGCAKACLYSAGRGRFSTIQKARIKKTRFFLDYREDFMRQLKSEISKHQRYCERNNMQCAVRLNGTSDIPWEKVKLDGISIMEHFPGVQFYDYTKNPHRNVEALPNYHLTFSRADGNEEHVETALSNGMNVAVVFRDELPDEYLGRKVIDGDLDDLRFLDGENVVVGLKAKGAAKKDTSGFVVDP